MITIILRYHNLTYPFNVHVDLPVK